MGATLPSLVPLCVSGTGGLPDLLRSRDRLIWLIRARGAGKTEPASGPREVCPGRWLQPAAARSEPPRRGPTTHYGTYNGTW
jgi:hypothetical protein